MLKIVSYSKSGSNPYPTKVLEAKIQPTSPNPLLYQASRTTSGMVKPPFSTGAVFSDLLQSSRLALPPLEKRERSARFCLRQSPYFARGGRPSLVGSMFLTTCKNSFLVFKSTNGTIVSTGSTVLSPSA